MNKYQYVCENYKKPKPILFNTEMVQAILEGRKAEEESGEAEAAEAGLVLVVCGNTAVLEEFKN